MYSDNEAKFQNQLTLKTEHNGERLAIFSSCHAERKKLSGLSGLNSPTSRSDVFMPRSNDAVRIRPFTVTLRTILRP
jgi:hypothetical protein